MMKKEFLQIFVVPAELYETDEKGIKELAKQADGIDSNFPKWIPTSDKVIIDQLIQEFNVIEFPKFYVMDSSGNRVTNDGIKDILEMDLEKIRKKWSNQNANKLDD